MPVAKGTRLGPYEIAAAIGAGGMGEVYRAKDTRLDRYVAIKVIHSNLPCTPEFKARFEREARTLSSLSHPHICSLYDVGKEGSLEFLVMELLDGETLSNRLRKGLLPVSAVVKLGIEIADALTAAHRVGVIHRDLKPANIMLTASGAKLMDFGLAKPSIADHSGGKEFAELATATMQNPPTPLSSGNTLIGTIQYMAPEQIEGKGADERSDIFALGAVLYEAVTGRRAFEGKTHISVASAILQKDPPPIPDYHSDIGLPPLEYTIRTCMAKEPEQRFQTAQDVKLQLNWVAQATATARQRPSRRRFAAVVTAAVMTIVALAIAVAFLAFGDRPSAAPDQVTRFTIALPSHQQLAVTNGQSLALSPDGKSLAYVAAENGVAHLFTRRLDSFEPVAIPDSDGAMFPFFSPNGEWIAFYVQGKLKKALANGGVPVVVCDVPTFFGATWTPKDTIVVAIPNYGLASVPASGGSLQKVQLASKEIIYPEGPNWFANGEWIAFTDYLSINRAVMAVKLSTGETRLILRSAQSPTFAGDHLIYFQGGAMWAVPFDSTRISVAGEAVRIASGINEEIYVAQASVSQNGILAYALGPAGSFTRDLYLVSRRGEEQKLAFPPQDYVDLVISPDGKRIACMFRSLTGQQLQVLDRSSGQFTTLVAGGMNTAPVWVPDGKSLIYDGVVPQQRGLFRIAADGSSTPQLLRTLPFNSHFTSVAGGYAAVMVSDPSTSSDIWLMNLQNPEDMHPFKNTAAAERQGALSPDGHWMAYASNESGRSEIYVEPVPGPGGRHQISTEGGDEPRWVRNGHEITYRNGSKMMSVPVREQPSFHTSKPVELFDRKFDSGLGVAGYDVTPDGQGFIMTRSQHTSPTEIRILMGWPAEKLAKQ
jgi:Tol biopolymer transport system component